MSLTKFEKIYCAVLFIVVFTVSMFLVNYRAKAVPPKPNQFCIGGNATFAWEYGPLYVKTYTSVECLDNNGFGCNLRRKEYVYIKNLNNNGYTLMFNAGDHAVAVDCDDVDFNTWTLTFENLPINREFVARTQVLDYSYVPPKLIGQKDVYFDTFIP